MQQYEAQIAIPTVESMAMALEAFEAIVGADTGYNYEWIDGRIYITYPSHVHCQVPPR